MGEDKKLTREEAEVIVRGMRRLVWCVASDRDCGHWPDAKNLAVVDADAILSALREPEALSDEDEACAERVLELNHTQERRKAALLRNGLAIVRVKP